MSCIVVLCVILLVSQIEMLPMSQGQWSALDQGSDTAVDVASSKRELAPLNQESDSSMAMKEVLSRVKRTVIGSPGCAEGMVRLYKGGICVTCEEYMERRETEQCPTRNR